MNKLQIRHTFASQDVADLKLGFFFFSPHTHRLVWQLPFCPGTAFGDTSFLLLLQLQEVTPAETKETRRKSLHKTLPGQWLSEEPRKKDSLNDIIGLLDLPRQHNHLDVTVFVCLVGSTALDPAVTCL